MAQYIDKDALVQYLTGMAGCACCDENVERIIRKFIIPHINTLEVKEVDLDESARHYLLHEHISPLNEILHQADLKVEMQYHKDIEDAYKAGFELRIKAQKGE